MVALALQLRKLGHEVRICAPPDFREWLTILGFRFGPEVRQTAARPSAAQAPPAPVQLRQLMEDTVAGQFEAITAAARG
jgi:vancomycin aglycone glucosyltransferase